MTADMVVTDEERDAGGSRASNATGRIKRGFAANMGGMGVTLIVQLVSVPVFLSAWGVPVYGEWLILSAFPTYLALSDLSFSSVAGNLMVMLVAKGRRTDAVDLGRRLWPVVSLMTGLVTIVAVAIAVILGGAIGSGAAISASEAQTVIVALFLQVAVSSQYGMLDAWYRTAGRYPLGTAMRQFGRLLEFGAIVGAVLLGAGPGEGAIAFLLGSVVGFGVSWVVLRQVVPWSVFRLERPHFQTFRELLAPGLAFMAFPIGNAISLQGFTLVIAATLGAPAVVVFSTTRTITRIPLQAVGAVNGAIWPELSRCVGGGRFQEARSILRRSVQVTLVTTLSLALGLALVGVTIIRWWTSGLVDAPIPLLLILLLVIVANSTWQTLGSLLAATNRHMRLAVLYLLGTTGALSLAIPLSAVFGLPGAATALLAIDLVMVAQVLPSSLRVVDDAPAPFLRALLELPKDGHVRSHA